MTAVRAFTVAPVHIPASIGSADAADFVAAIEVRNAVEKHSYGTDELDYSPAEMLPRGLAGGHAGDAPGILTAWHTP